VAGWVERLNNLEAGYAQLLTVGVMPPWFGDKSAPAEVVVVECLGM
jgi:hypothetical protein